MTTWITSDLHFGHDNIRKFCPDTRGHFKDAHEMNRALIKEWQDKVQPHDTIIDLGDLFFCNQDEARSIMNQLPGHKIHVYGNHDKIIRNNVDLQKMFSGGCHEYYEITHNKTHAVLFHYPIAEFNRMHHGAVHLHGHLHGKPSGMERWRVREVSWDASGGRILTLDEAIKIALQGEVKTHH